MSQTAVDEIPTWVITDHAIERYRQRVQRVPYEEAIGAIQRELLGSHFVKQCEGYELWRSPKPRRLRIRVRRNEGRLEVMTIIPAHDGLTRRQ